MIDQHDQHPAAFQRGVDVDQFGRGPFELARELGGIGFDHLDPFAEPARQPRRHGAGRAFAEIVDIGLEGEAEAGDRLAGVGLDQLFGAGDHVVDLAVVDPARGADQRGFLGRAVDDEPGVDRDAVAAHARAGLEDVDPRVAVGQPDHFPHIKPHLVGNDAQLVGEGDVDVAIGVLDQLGHFGAAGVGGDAGPAHEALVEGQRLSGAARGDPADRAIVVGQFFQDLAGQDALRTIGDRDVGSLGREPRTLQVGPARGDQIAQRFGRADRAGRFEDHAVTGLEHPGDRFARGEDIGDVGRVIGVERGRHGDDEDVGRGHLGRGLEQPARNHAMDQPVEIDFLDVDFAAVDRIDHALRHVDAVDLAARPRHDGGGRQPDITQPDDTNVRFNVRFHSRSAPRSGARSARPRRGCGPAP